MSTKFLSVYEYAFAEIDDVRLDNLMSENPALFLRRAWDYMRNAIPLFTSPKGEQERLKNLVEPAFSDALYTSDGTTDTFDCPLDIESVAVTIGETVIAVLEASEDDPNPSANGVTYNSEEGKIVFDTPPDAGQEISLDFYTDGYFDADLNVSELNILGQCFRIVWFAKVANTYLRTTPKIKDKNFNTDSSWGIEQADTAKLRAMRIELHDMMAQYEQDLAYGVNVPTGAKLLNRVQAWGA